MSQIRPFADCHYAECRSTECRYAECHYAVCCGAEKVIENYKKSMLIYGFHEIDPWLKNYKKLLILLNRLTTPRKQLSLE
jgi:hypothetical protein